MRKAWFKMTGLMLVAIMLLGYAVAANNISSGQHRYASYNVTLNATTGKLQSIGTYNVGSYSYAYSVISTSGTTFFGVARVEEYSIYDALVPTQSDYTYATLTAASPSTSMSNCSVFRFPYDDTVKYIHTGSLSIPGTGVTPDTFKYIAYQDY